MTNLTVAEVYAIGLPIIYGMIALEAIFSSNYPINLFID
jgi:hypothetical protein